MGRLHGTKLLKQNFAASFSKSAVHVQCACSARACGNACVSAGACAHISAHSYSDRFLPGTGLPLAVLYVAA